MPSWKIYREPPPTDVSARVTADGLTFNGGTAMFWTYGVERNEVQVAFGPNAYDRIVLVKDVKDGPSDVARRDQ